MATFRFARVLGSAGIAIGLAGLIGWVLRVPALLAPLPGTRAMVPNTALMLMLGGIALIALAREPVDPWRRRTAQTAATIVVVLAVVALAQYVAGVDLGIARPAPNTATVLVLLGIALLAIDRPARRGVAVAEVLAFLVGAHSVLVLSSYVYGYVRFAAPTALPENVGMAAHAAVGALLLAAGILFARPSRGAMAILASRHAGGVMARRILLISAITIPSLDLFSAELEHLGLYTGGGTAAVHSVASGGVLVVALLVVGAMANRADREREHVMRELARWKELVASAEDAIIATTPEGIVTEWNPGAERLYGFRADEMVGRGVDAIVPEDRRAELAALLERFGRGEPIAAHETERQRKDGSRVPISLTWSRIADADDRTIGICAVERDITERHAAEEVARRAHDELVALTRANLAVSHAMAGIADSGLDHVLDVIAAQARELTGAGEASVVLDDDGRGAPPWPRGLGPLPRARGTLRGAIVAPDAMMVPVSHHGHPIGTLHLAGRADDAPFTERDQHLVAMLATHVGSAIEASRLYEREALQRAWLESIVSQMPEAVLAVDDRGAVVLENPVAREYRGDLRTPAGRPIAAADLPLDRAIRDGETTQGLELAIARPDGSSIPILASATPVRSGERVVGAVAVFHDIQILKKLERLREEWTSVIAHDLRQPINSMRLAAELLQRGELSARGRTWAERIVADALRLDRMVQDLLDASRVEARQLSLRVGTVRLLDLVGSVLDRMPELAPRCEVRIDSDADSLLADPGRLLQVLSNLLSNAGKYGDPGTPVRVEAVRDDAMARIAVVNHGPDLTTDECAGLFTRFHRTERARRSGVDGIGLGLYLCKGLVEAHGGEITVESAGGVTRFLLTLPIAAQEQPQLTGTSHAG